MASFYGRMYWTQTGCLTGKCTTPRNKILQIDKTVTHGFTDKEENHHTLCKEKVRTQKVASSIVSSRVTWVIPYVSVPRLGQYWSHLIWEKQMNWMLDTVCLIIIINCFKYMQNRHMNIKSGKTQQTCFPFQHRCTVWVHLILIINPLWIKTSGSADRNTKVDTLHFSKW